MMSRRLCSAANGIMRLKEACAAVSTFFRDRRVRLELTAMKASAMYKDESRICRQTGRTRIFIVQDSTAVVNWSYGHGSGRAGSDELSSLLLYAAAFFGSEVPPTFSL